MKLFLAVERAVIKECDDAILRQQFGQRLAPSDASAEDGYSSFSAVKEWPPSLRMTRHADFVVDGVEERLKARPGRVFSRPAASGGANRHRQIGIHNQPFHRPGQCVRVVNGGEQRRVAVTRDLAMWADV